MRKPLKITSVTYRTSVPGFKAYQHHHIEVTAEVQAGTTAEETLDQCRAFVDRELVRAKRDTVLAEAVKKDRFRREMPRRQSI